MSLRVLVVDDTVVYRKIVTDVLAQIPGVEIAGTASNGKIALSRIRDMKPDLLTLDIEMPEMNGLEVLQAIKAQSLNVGAIVVSSLTVKGGELTMKALELGAFDFITKPEGGSTEANLASIKKALELLLKAFDRRKEIATILRGTTLLPKLSGANGKLLRDGKSVVSRMGNIVNRQKSEAIGIGISTGGPNALAELLPDLPADINVPILLVQHMPPYFTQSMAQSLDSKCALKVKEAENGEPVQNNVVYVAPGGKQM